jgi:hypothetical protein
MTPLIANRCCASGRITEPRFAITEYEINLHYCNLIKIRDWKQKYTKYVQQMIKLKYRRKEERNTGRPNKCDQ